MNAWHLWVILGMVFFIIEIFTPAFLFASLGIGAFIAGIVACYDYSITAQISALSVGTFIVFIGIRPILKLMQSNKTDNRKIGVDALIGQEAVVIEEIDHASNSGRIKLGGEEWKACSVDKNVFKKGSTVIVQNIEGVTAQVAQNSNEN